VSVPIIAIIDGLGKTLAAKKRDSEADTTGWEREIDRLVYALYGLTDEEIESGALGADKLDQILARHGLLEKWERFGHRFLGDNQ